LTYEGDIVEVVVVVEDDESFKPVLGCFWMVSSWPSNVLRYWMCWGEGTGIKLGSSPLLDSCLLLWQNNPSKNVMINNKLQNKII